MRFVNFQIFLAFLLDVLNCSKHNRFQVIFQFELTSTNCPQNAQSDVVSINSNSIQDTATLTIG